MSPPESIDHVTRTLKWSIPRLHAGEERVYTYIIYSNLKVIGRLELPITSSTFKQGEEHHHVSSNRTFFDAETTRLEEF